MNFLALLLCTVILSSCNTSITNNISQAVNKVKKDEPIVYNLLRENFSNILILKASFSLEQANREVFNGIEYDYIDMNSLDSLARSNNLKNVVIEKVNSMDSLNRERLTIWCQCYVICDYIFSNLPDSLYIEDVLVEIEPFNEILPKYLYPSQTIDSFSAQQSEMFYLDFITYLSILDFSNRKGIIDDLPAPQ